MSPRRANIAWYPRNQSVPRKPDRPAATGRPKDGTARMNKGEARYAALLDQRQAAGLIAGWWFEALSWRLADDTRYVPDFLVLHADGRLEVHEVKGRSGTEFVVTDTAWVKLKVTAEQMPWPLLVVWQGKDGHWSERTL